MTKKDWKDKEKCERFYQNIIFMMFNMFNKNTHVEVKSIRGRADIVVFGKKSVFVLEVKINSSPEDALQQIEDKGYNIKR